MADPATELVSGARRIGGAALDERVRRAAAGLAALGVARGDCVAILMRNDIPFIETAYAAQALGAYSVPVNWHFKAEEIVYILGDCGARVLVGHADLIAPVAAALPKGVAVIAAATPPEVASAYGIAPVPPSAVPGAQDYEAWLASHAPHRGEMPSPAAHHVLHLGHHRPSQGRAPPRADAGADGGSRAPAPRRVRHHPRHPLRRARPALPLRAQRVRHARGPRRPHHGADAALRSRGPARAHRARAPRHHVHGADHVHPPAQAARGRARGATTPPRSSSSSTPPRPARTTSSAR